MTDENSDVLWTVRNLFEILNKTFSKFYCLSEHLAVSSYNFVQKKGHSPKIRTQETQTFWHQNLQIM